MSRTLPLLLATLTLLCASHVRAESPERTAEEFVHISTAQGARAAVVLYQFSEVQRVRDKVMLSVERETESGRKQVRTLLFGGGVSLEDLRHMTPENLLLAIMTRLPERTTLYDEFKALGAVKEGDTMHIVVRASLKNVERLRRRSIVQVVTLLPSGKEWRAAIPSWLEAHIDDILTVSPIDLPPITDASPSLKVTKDPAWAALLTRGVELLNQGNCLTYFLDVMEPGFSKTMTQKAFDAIVRGCELNARTREKFRTGLELALAREPTVANGGLRVIYDVAGEGLPYDRIVLTRVEQRWYVAE